jgi:hypothetical protein
MSPLARKSADASAQTGKKAQKRLQLLAKDSQK